jgi:hypothetical protein
VSVPSQAVKPGHCHRAEESQREQSEDAHYASDDWRQGPRNRIITIQNRDWLAPVSYVLGIHRFHVLRLITLESAPADQHLLLLIIEP